MFGSRFGVRGLAMLGVLAGLIAIGPASADQGWRYYGGNEQGGRGYESGQYYGNYGGSFAPGAYYPQPAYYGQPYYATPGTAVSPQGTATYQSFYPPDTDDFGQGASGERPVRLQLAVPAGAEVWFDNTKTTQTGAQRQFVSPPLTPGQDYHYNLKVQWNQDGKTVERTRRVNVHAGDRINLSFDAAQSGSSDNR